MWDGKDDRGQPAPAGRYTVFVEGWALYAERLMEQLGYLDDPADRLGMLDGQRMRAARAVC